MVSVCARRHLIEWIDTGQFRWCIECAKSINQCGFRLPERSPYAYNASYGLWFDVVFFRSHIPQTFDTFTLTQNTLITIKNRIFLIVRFFVCQHEYKKVCLSIDVCQFHLKFYKWSFNECTNTRTDHTFLGFDGLFWVFFSSTILCGFFSWTHPGKQQVHRLNCQFSPINLLFFFTLFVFMRFRITVAFLYLQQFSNRFEHFGSVLVEGFLFTSVYCFRERKKMFKNFRPHE